MNLQTALVIIAALGVNGLPGLEQRAVEQPPIVTISRDCVIGKPFCTPPEETGKAKRQYNRWTQPSFGLPQPTQRPPTEKRQKNTEGFSPQPRPNTPKEGLKNSNGTGTLKFPPRPTNGSPLQIRKPVPKAPLEKPDQPTQPGQAPNCNGWYTLKNVDTCNSVVKEFDIKKEEFLEWNPAVSKNCEKNFWANYSYCVKVFDSKKTKRNQLITSTAAPPSVASLVLPFGAPIKGRAAPYTTREGAWIGPVTITGAKRAVSSPTANPSSSLESTSMCLQYDLATKGDTCQTMAVKHGLTVAELRTINNHIDNICTSIKSGLNYCVSELLWLNDMATSNIVDLTPNLENEHGKQDETPATARKQSTGLISDCVRQWFVGPKDTCESIASVAGISVAELVALNPVTLANCGNITRYTLVCLRAAKPTPLLPTPLRSGVPVGASPALSRTLFTNYTKAP